MSGDKSACDGADTTASKRNAQLAAIVAASTDAIISMGTDLAVQTWNAGAQSLFGYSEAEAIGRSIVELIIPNAHEVECGAICAAAMGSRTAVLKETVRRHKDGRILPVETNVSPIFDGSGNITGLSIILRDISERRRAEDALQRHAERQALLLKITSDLIYAVELSELGRLTFQHVGPALGADICTNFRLDPGSQHLKLEFESGIPPELSEAVQSLELGQAYCGIAAASRQPVVADEQRIACDRTGALVRALGATAYACRPLLASDGCLLGTFAVASRTRESFTEDEVTWLGTVINFLAQIWERLEAEQGLRESEERLRLAQNAAGLGHWDFDFAAGTLVWSEQTRKLLGLEPKAAASRALLLSLVHVEDRPRLEEHIARSARPEPDHGRHLEFRIVMQNGAVRWLEDQSRVETNAAGTPVRAVGIMRDITARKNAEEAQARLAAIVTSSADAIVGKTLDGIVTSWNEAAERMFGFAASEMIGQSIRRLIPADLQPEEDMILTRLARNECIAQYETKRLGKNGRIFDASITVSPVRDVEGRIIGAAKIIRDVTERKQTEARLAEREALLALFVEHAPAVIAMFDDKMRYLAVSRRYVSDFRLPPDIELIGRSHYEIFPEIPPRWRRVHARVLAGEELAHEEDPFLRQDGWTDWCRWLMKPWRTADGRIGGVLLFSEVITEQVEARRALRESEATFRAMFDVSSVGKSEVDPESTRFLRVNAAVCKFVGYSEAELLTRTVLDITHPDERERDREAGRRLVTGESSVFDVEKRYICKDGKAVWARTTVNVIRDAQGRALRNIVVIQDINDRVQAEQALQASKDRLQLAMDAAQLGWWQYDPLRHLVSGDARFRAIFDVAAREMPIEDIMKRVHPDDGERARAAIEAALNPVDPKPYATEYRVRPVVSGVRWVEAHGLARFAGTGRERHAVRLVGTAQDITDRKEREERERLLMREVNHRAKNMLSVVDSIARQTAARNPEDFVERFSERIQALAANQDLLVRNEWKGVEIDDLVRAQLAHFVDFIGSRIVVRGPKLRLNPASAQAIGLALHELATNAAKYGALSTDSGRTDISWETDGDTFAMSWTERYGPVSPPTQRGFGTIVIETMTQRSVGGEVELDYAPSGVTWRLICPAANALETCEREQNFRGTDKSN